MPLLRGQSRKRGYKIRKSGISLTVEFEIEYYVLADSVDQPLIEIINTPGIPLIGDQDGPTRAVGHSADNDPNNALLYTVTIEYSSEVDDDSSGASQQGQDFGDPTLWVPIAEFAFETYSEVRLTDAAGNAVVNSAKQPFETGIPQKRSIVRYDFDQFEPGTTDLDTISDRNETVNDAIFVGKAAKTLLLTIRKATFGFYFGFRAWRIGYSLGYKKDDWRVKRLDIGNTFLSGGVLKPYEDDEGNRIVGPLDGAGAKQTAGTAPAILNFDTYATSTFSDFLRVTNLPTG